VKPVSDAPHQRGRRAVIVEALQMHRAMRLRRPRLITAFWQQAELSF
jgi:hypothetical protein